MWTPRRIEYSFCVPAVLAFDVNLAQALADFAVLHDAVDFADDGGVAGLAGFEELDDARETSGDVLGLGGFARDFREDVARLDFVAILHHQVRAGRHQVLLAGAARRIADQNRRRVLFVARRQRDDELRKAGDFVHLLLDGDAGLQVLELNRASDFGEDRECIRIPFRQDLADLTGWFSSTLNSRRRRHGSALFRGPFRRRRR